MQSLEPYPKDLPNKFAATLQRIFPADTIKEVVTGSKYADYQDDPVGFGEKVLGETYTDEIKTMMESVRDNRITIARSCNDVGKTHGAARVGAWFFLSFPNSQVYTAAAPPEGNLKRLLWGEIGSILEDHPELFEGHKISSLHIERAAKSFLTGVTIPSSGTSEQREAKFSGKHAPYLLFILDEGDAIPDEVYQGIEGCMSGGHVRLLIMYNPRAERGEAYRMERDGLANIVELSAFRHPNVTTGKELIIGAVDRETVVRRTNLWCRPLKEKEPCEESAKFTLPEFLVGTTAVHPKGGDFPLLQAGEYKIKNPAYSYMVLGRYPAQGSNQLISREWTSRARTRWDLYVAEYGEVPPVGVRGVAGQDVAEEGDDLSVFTARYGGYVEMPVIWGGVDPMVTADKAVEETEERSISHVNVDATGLGSGVAPAMRRQEVPAYGIKVASSPTEETEEGEFKILRDQLLWGLREWLRIDPGAMLPPCEELLEEMHVLTYEKDKGKIRVMPKDDIKEHIRRSPDYLDSLSLTFAPVNALFDADDLLRAFT